MLRGKSPKSVEPIQPGYVRITGEDGQSLDVPLAALRLYGELTIRVAIEQVVAPLDKEGIDTFDVRDETGAEIVKVEKRDAPSFARPELPDEPIVDETRRAAYSIISLAFKEDNKWRLSDGSSQISARIDDRAFLDRVEANQVAFAKGDILVCDVRTTATQTATGLKTDYVVERVIEHRTAMRQLRLFEDPPQSPHRDTA